MKFLKFILLVASISAIHFFVHKDDRKSSTEVTVQQPTLKSDFDFTLQIDTTEAGNRARAEKLNNLQTKPVGMQVK
jgi:hypothetical protein